MIPRGLRSLGHLLYLLRLRSCYLLHLHIHIVDGGSFVLKVPTCSRSQSSLKRIQASILCFVYSLTFQGNPTGEERKALQVIYKPGSITG